MIRVQNLTKWYGSHLAVDNISFHVSEGEIVGFLGPNGAGKSTTIRVLTCFHPASSGSASINGYDVFTESIKVRQSIGYLPESAPLYPEMRVSEYLMFRAQLRGIPRYERSRAIRTSVDRCWVGDFFNRPISQLSKGMKQRVGLAETLIHDPKVLILDEPTIGLDPTQIRETRKLMKELGQRHTLMLSSHILSEVEAVCDRAVIIAGGRIVASGSPAELRERITAQSRLIAEIKGPAEEVRSAVGCIAGVSKVDLQLADGWNRLYVEADKGRDVREELYGVTHTKGWSLREMRREVASLEDFFVQITARQADQKSS